MLSHGRTKEKPQTSAPQGHIAWSIGNSAPPPIKRPRNAVKTAVDALWPWSDDSTGSDGKPPYPGFYASVRGLIGSRAAFETVRQWFKGRRGAPNWFRSLLLDHLRQRKAEIEEAIQALEAMPERRGTGAGLRDWWREKKARENAAQTKLERDKARSLR